jgi:aconitate decarboxylase
MTKPLQVGRAAQAGIVAAGLAQSGLDASGDAIDGPAGLLVALAGGQGSVDRSPGLGEGFMATLVRQRPGVKKYPVCYATHRCIDGILDLREAHDLTVDRVNRIEAQVSEAAAGVLRHHHPTTVTEARFSLEFVLACALVHGAVGVREVSESALNDARIRQVMDKVRIRTVNTRCPLEPSFAYEDRVTVTLRDGTLLDSGPIRFALGHAERPIDANQIRAKMLNCVPIDEQLRAHQIMQQMEEALGG